MRRPPAHSAVLGACALSLAVLLAACGQKGPLFLPAQGGPAAKPAGPVPSAATPLAPIQGASSPGLPAAAAPAS